MPALISGVVVKYCVLAVLGLGALGWFVNGIIAPYRAQIVTLQANVKAHEEAAAAKEAIAERDRHRAEVAEAEAERRDATLESYLHEAKKSGSKLTSVELDRLRELAGARSATRR